MFFFYFTFFEKNFFGAEKKFGSGAASFFKLLKRFIFQNLIVSLGKFKKKFLQFLDIVLLHTFPSFLEHISQKKFVNKSMLESIISFSSLYWISYFLWICSRICKILQMSSFSIKIPENLQKIFVKNRDYRN